jgi:DNA-binding MarR family transcriptional regulator
MADTTHDPAGMQRINNAILQFLLDGEKGRNQVAEDVSRMTGMRLSASALLIVERLGTESMRVNDLGASVGLSSGGITRQIQDLEAKGLIDRTTDERDKRAAIVKLSNRGLDVIRLTGSVRDFSTRHALQGWTDEEVMQIAPLLERLALGLSEGLARESVRRAVQLERTISVDEWIRLIEAE